MSGLICNNCGRQTNTAVSDWLNPIRKDGKANKCYVAWVDGEWVRGCGYEEADEYNKPFADSLLGPEK